MASFWVTVDTDRLGKVLEALELSYGSAARLAAGKACVDCPRETIGVSSDFPRK